MKILTNDLIAEKIYNSTLPNGLELYIIPKKGFFKNIGIAGVRFGSMDMKFSSIKPEKEITVPAGCAHFLEHQLFKKEEGDIFYKFAETGAECNAYTSFNITAYHFIGENHIKRNIDTLTELVFRNSFTDNFVEKEKPIIIQEIAMRKDMPDLKGFINLLNALYINNPVKIDPEGTKDSVLSITKSDLELLHNNFYSPSNAILVIAGDIDPKEMESYITSKTASFTANEKTISGRIIPDEPKNVNKQLISIDMDVPRDKVYLGFKCDPSKDISNTYRNSIIKKIMLSLTFGKTTEFYQTAYKDGLIDDTFSFSFDSEKQYSFIYIACDVDDFNKFKDCIIKRIKEVKKTGFRNEDINRVKKRMLGSYIRKLDSPLSLGMSCFESFIRDINFLDFPEIINEIDEGDVKAGLNYLDLNRLAISHISSKKIS